MYNLKLLLSSLPCRLESCRFRIQTQVLEERSQRHSWTAAPQKSLQFTSNPKLLQPVSGKHILGAIADMEESSSNVEGQKSWSQKTSRKSFLFVLVQLRAAKGREVFDFRSFAVSPFSNGPAIGTGWGRQERTGQQWWLWHTELSNQEMPCLFQSI